MDHALVLDHGEEADREGEDADEDEGEGAEHAAEGVAEAAGRGGGRCRVGHGLRHCGRVAADRKSVV